MNIYKGDLKTTYLVTRKVFIHFFFFFQISKELSLIICYKPVNFMED